MYERRLCLAAGLVCSIIGGCRPSGGGGATAAPAAATGNISGGGGDRCADARLIAAPAVISGDLTSRHDDSNARIEVTSYAWAGRDDFFAMDMTAGQTVTFVLDDRGGFDGGMYVFRDCANIPGTVVGGLDTTPTRPFVFAAPAAGHYIIAVDAWITNTGGPYTLTVTPGGTPTPAAAPAAAAPASGGGWNGGPVTVGQTVTGSLVPGQAAVDGHLADDFQLALGANQPVTIVTRGGTGPAGGGTLDVLTVLLCNGAEVARDDDSAGNLNSRIVYTAPSASQCIVRVTTFSPTANGPYQLQVYAGAMPTQS